MRNFDTQGLPKTILQLNINKEDVIAYFGQRNEFEIIYLHESGTFLTGFPILSFHEIIIYCEGLVNRETVKVM